MRHRHIRKFLDPARRFHPLVVRTASGEGYRVPSREMIWMSPDGVVLIVYEPDEGVTMIDTEDVTEVVREIKKPKPDG